MYLSRRSALVRNASIATINGGVTLIILLIAPLGLAAVIINTILVTIASFITATAADRVVLFLTPPSKFSELDRDRNSPDLVTSGKDRQRIDRH